MITKSWLLLRIDVPPLDPKALRRFSTGNVWETKASTIEPSSGVIKRLEITCLTFHLYTKAYKTFFAIFFSFFFVISLVYWLNTQHYASALFTSLVNNISSSSRWLAFSYCFPQISTFFPPSFFLCLFISCNHQI